MSDDEEQYNPNAHKTLLQTISSLGKVQHVKKSTRSEPRAQQSEFALIKSASVIEEASKKRNVVPINDIVQVLKRTKKNLDTGKQLRNVQKTKKVLDKPLEKPVADRMKRTIGYENVKKKLGRWDAVVSKNRHAETQVFPLKSETIYIDTSVFAKPIERSVKSDLMLQFEESDAKLQAIMKLKNGETIEDAADLAKRERELLDRHLTREELIAKRKELAYLKMRESQKSAKARKQNKIKSKKYHKMLKRQKLQEQLKQFELLQKTNPEAALEKLNELEKHRILERATLRHKNTGAWAKNLQVRAKYDKDVRQDLAEQLEKSRELTEKKETFEESDEDMEESKINGNNDVDDDDYDPFNPWMNINKKAPTKADIEKADKTNWRKYWLERNANEKLLEAHKNDLKELVNDAVKSEEDSDDVEEKPTPIIVNKKSNQTQKLKKRKPIIENGWVIEEINPVVAKKEINIDDIFDKKEDYILNELNKKRNTLEKASNKLKTLKVKKQIIKRKKDALKGLKDLSFKNTLKIPIIDENLNEDQINPKEIKQTNGFVDKQSNDIKKEEANKENSKHDDDEQESIDPKKILTVKLKEHFFSFDDITDSIADAHIEEPTNDDERLNNLLTEHQLTISEAFEDDDIVADFTKDKKKDTEIKDTEIQLGLPGWGGWAGAGISQERIERQQQRFNNKRLLLKKPAAEKRRDENKNGVYINEEVNKHLRSHLVSDIPFPFKSIKDYEASIRAPIGRNYVPETALRMLTRPAVITRKGAVIEPMDESELVKKARPLRNVVDRRIEKAQQQRVTKVKQEKKDD